MSEKTTCIPICNEDLKILGLEFAKDYKPKRIHINFILNPGNPVSVALVHLDASILSDERIYGRCGTDPDMLFLHARMIQYSHLFSLFMEAYSEWERRAARRRFWRKVRIRASWAWRRVVRNRKNNELNHK